MSILGTYNKEDAINDEEINQLKEEIAILESKLNKKSELLKIKQVI